MAARRDEFGRVEVIEDEHLEAAYEDRFQSHEPDYDDEEPYDFEDDGQPDDLTEHQDFAHDDDFSNMEPSDDCPW